MRQEAFIKAVRAKLGLTQTQLGVELRKPNAYKTVHDWETGRLKVSYADTIKLLEMTSWISPEAAAAAQQVEAESLDELGQDLKGALGRWPEEQQPEQDQPAKPRRTSGGPSRKRAA